MQDAAPVIPATNDRALSTAGPLLCLIVSNTVQAAVYVLFCVLSHFSIGTDLLNGSSANTLIP